MKQYTYNSSQLYEYATSAACLGLFKIVTVICKAHATQNKVH